MTREDYVKKLKDIAKDVVNLSNIRGNMTGKVMLDAIRNPIFIEHELKHVFVVKPTFAWYKKVDEIYCRMIKVKIPDEDEWSKLCNY